MHSPRLVGLESAALARTQRREVLRVWQSSNKACSFLVYLELSQRNPFRFGATLLYLMDPEMAQAANLRYPRDDLAPVGMELLSGMKI